MAGSVNKDDISKVYSEEYIARLRDMPVDFAVAAEAIKDPRELDEFDPVIDIIIEMESM